MHREKDQQHNLQTEHRRDLILKHVAVVVLLLRIE